MRRSRLYDLVVFCLGTLAISTVASAQPRPDWKATADRIAAEATTRYLPGRSRAEWRRVAPTAAWRDRRGSLAYPPESARPTHRGLWCSSATDVSGIVSREAVFYALRTERPYDCRLEQLRYVIRTTSADPFDALAAAFERTLARDELSFVPLTDTRRSEMSIGLNSTALTEYRADEWRDVRYWMAPTAYIYLFRYHDTVQVFEQTYFVATALYDDASTSTSEDRYGVSLDTWNLINRLRPRDPEAVDLILSNQAVPDQDLVERVTRRLLGARAAARLPADRVMLTAAVERTSAKLRVEGTRPEEARPSLRSLLGMGVTMRESPYDPGIWYGGFNPNGQTAPAERGGTFQYRDIITWNLSEIRRHPRRVSPLRLLELAKAYETWWSLSMAADDEELVTRSDHALGAANARVQALRWYEHLIRQFPYSREAEQARRVIIQIRLGVDTGQRAYFAPYA